MRWYVQALAVCNLTMGGLAAIANLYIFWYWRSFGSSSNFQAKGLLTMASVILDLMALIYIAGGWGLLTRKPKARHAMLLVSLFNLLAFPIGTAVGLFGIWVLGHKETKLIFSSPGEKSDKHSQAASA